MPKLLIIDSHAVLHRAFHALPDLKTKKGELINAVYGFLLVLLRALKELQPEFVVAAFDLPGPTFRHKEFREYKAQRPVYPKEFYDQIDKTKKVLKSFDIPVFEKQGFEADDIIGTIAKMSLNKQILPRLEVIILSADLDMLQLVNSNVKVWTMKKGIKDTILYGEQEVKQRYELKPLQLADYRGLKGDASDNIPGVPGIGEKGAINLIKEFGDLDNLYKELEQGTDKVKGKVKENLIKHKEEAFFSKKLSQINKNVPLDFQINDCKFSFDKNKVIKTLKEFEFYTLIKRLG